MNLLPWLLIILSVSAGAQQSTSIDREGVRKTVANNIKKLKECYSEELKNEPAIEGKVVLSWDIEDSGNVKTANVKSSTLKNSKTEDCMLVVIKSIKFPPAPKGTVANINHPFVFGKNK